MSNRILATCFLLLCVSACTTTKPPMPPEPKGPLVKINANQPHDKFQEPQQ